LGHIAGSLLVPLPELERRAGELPRGRPLLMVCRSGARSGRACAQVAALGLGPATNLAGGMIGWNRAGLPLERERPASRAALLASAAAWLAQVTGKTPEAVGAELHARLAEQGETREAPSRAGVASALDWIEGAAGTPPDRDLSLAAFRAALAEL
jgi:hypothetical protein